MRHIDETACGAFITPMCRPEPCIALTDDSGIERYPSGGCPAIHAACKGRLAWDSPAAVRADISYTMARCVEAVPVSSTSRALGAPHAARGQKRSIRPTSAGVPVPPQAGCGLGGGWGCRVAGRTVHESA